MNLGPLVLQKVIDCIPGWILMQLSSSFMQFRHQNGPIIFYSLYLPYLYYATKSFKNYISTIGPI